MSRLAFAWVLEESKTEDKDRLVLLAMANEAGDDGGDCYPGVRRLAKTSRSHTKTVVKATERLEAGGEILVIRPERKGRGRFNRYLLLMGRTPEEAVAGLGDEVERDRWAPEVMRAPGARVPESKNARECAPQERANPLTLSNTARPSRLPSQSTPRPKTWGLAREVVHNLEVEGFGSNANRDTRRVARAFQDFLDEVGDDCGPEVLELAPAVDADEIEITCGSLLQERALRAESQPPRDEDDPERREYEEAAAAEWEPAQPPPLAPPEPHGATHDSRDQETRRRD
jgi:Helix-turn-helix domain